MTTTTLTSKYNVTEEQIDACTRVIDNATNTVFYQVESQSNPGTYYKVVYNREHRVLQCTNFENGPVCPASAKGLPCWHKRAALAAEEEYKLLKAAEHQAEVRQAASQMTLQEVQEQGQIEAYVRQGIDRGTATRVVYAQGPRYNEQDIRQAQYLNQPNAFCLLK